MKDLALNHLQEAVAAVELLATRKDPAAIKEAKERYLFASQSLNALISCQPSPEQDHSIEELKTERDRLKEQVLQKEQTLVAVSELGQDLLSTLERWDQWDLDPKPRPRQVNVTHENEETKSITETESITSDL